MVDAPDLLGGRTELLGEKTKFKVVFKDKYSFFIEAAGLSNIMFYHGNYAPLYQAGRYFWDSARYVYSQGAAFVRMLSYAIGEKHFQRGISKYLKKY